MANRLLAGAFHRVCFREAVPPTYDDTSTEREFDSLDASAVMFLSRFADVDLAGKSVLDIGSALGNLCVQAAKHGASKVVGVDAEPLDKASTELIARRFPELADRITLLQTEGDMRELGSEQFDVVLSKDSFEHYPNPESFVHLIIDRLVPGGLLAVHFAPLWKSPKGGHIDFMTPVPWAHLLFPEDVIMAERKRFRPAEAAERFQDIRGGLNKMTLARFQALMAATDLECLHFAANESDKRSVRVMSTLARVPGLREYMTTSITGLWRKPS